VCFCGFVVIYFFFLYGLSRLMRMLLGANQSGATSFALFISSIVANFTLK
jgi:hypothetical protein